MKPLRSMGKLRDNVFPGFFHIPISFPHTHPFTSRSNFFIDFQIVTVYNIRGQQQAGASGAPFRASRDRGMEDMEHREILVGSQKVRWESVGVNDVRIRYNYIPATLTEQEAAQLTDLTVHTVINTNNDQ